MKRAEKGGMAADILQNKALRIYPLRGKRMKLKESLQTFPKIEPSGIYSLKGKKGMIIKESLQTFI